MGRWCRAACPIASVQRRREGSEKALRRCGVLRVARRTIRETALLS